jgi:uncharacterized paraquat-inducible protein A
MALPMQQHAGHYASANETDIEERKAALFDMGYLVVALNLYVASFIVPVIGVVAGLMLLIGGAHERPRRVGKLCLIIAAAAILLWIGLALLWFVVLAGVSAVS